MERSTALAISSFVVRWGGLVCGALLISRAWHAQPAMTWVAVAVLALAAFIAELTPIWLTSRGSRGAAVTFSQAFLLALMAIAPPGVVLLARYLPMVLDDLRARKPISLILLNLGQAALALAGCRLVYAQLSGDPYFTPSAFTTADVLPLAAAAAAYFLIERTIFGVVLSLRGDSRMWAFVLGNAGEEGANLIAESSLAVLALLAADFHPLVVTALLVPLLGVRRSIQLSQLREQEALQDALTGLPNRAALAARLSDLLDEADKSSDVLGILLIDLDRFREINNILGHGVGDLLISDVAVRLSAELRQEDLVVRFAGDEFAVVSRLSPAGAEEEARLLAGRLLDALAEPFDVHGVRIDVRASIGIALAPEHGRLVDELMSRADAALYVAKQARGTSSMYGGDNAEGSPAQLSLLGELRVGIESDELELHYQPKIDLLTGEVRGVEALVRWNHPEQGLLPPFAFIPLAEKTGLIKPLTMVVLDTALAQTRSWLELGWELTMSVNLSARHILDEGLPQEIVELLMKHRVPARLLTIEVTESSIMTDPTRAAEVLHVMRGFGIQVSVDDFGTGYSSFSHLRQLEIDEIKIDRSFVSSMLSSSQDRVLVEAVIDLGHSLGMRVVAEGVEDADTQEELRALGCDEIQGFFISRPQAAAAVTAWLASRQPVHLHR